MYTPCKMVRNSSHKFELQEQLGYGELDGRGSPTSSKRHLSISRKAVFAFVLCSVLLATFVGLLVFFLHPDRGGTCGSVGAGGEDSSARTWDQCLEMAKSMNECLPIQPCPDESQQTTASPPSEPHQQTNLSYRLPETFRPLHYDVDIKPDIYDSSPEQFNFTGNVSMNLSCAMEPCLEIYIHYKLLEIDNASVKALDGNSDNLPISGFSFDQERDFFIVELEDPVTAGDSVKVEMSFRGSLNRDMAGIYWSSYRENGTDKYMIATQFESTDARKAFPCLDEPHLKATFSLSLWHRDGKIALANTNKTSQTNRTDGWSISSFESTPQVMPTYLVAFAVADFEFIDDWIPEHDKFPGKYMRFFSRPAFIEAGQANYAREVSAPMFNFFETYFNEPFSFQKTDQIAIPDFSAGAMENWGLITYRESRLLYDPRFTSSYDVWRFTKTIAHELLHQWIGNIVTCRWWDDLWLQEGAARYFENLAVQEAQPTWNQSITYQTYTMFSALRGDQTGESHPVNNPGIEEYSELESMFSVITYDKGSTVYRMVDLIIFRDNQTAFNEAMRTLIQRHKFGNIDNNDLLVAFEEAAKEAGLDIDVNITEFGFTWIKQSGYPVVTLTRANDKLEIAQSRFLQNPEKPIKEFYPSPYNYTWTVPVSFYSDLNPTSPDYIWLTEDNTTVNITTAAAWIVGNYHQLGFYRVNYDDNNWEKLIQQLWMDHTVINVYQRGQLIDDAFHLARANITSQLHSLRITEYLINETEFSPWYAADYGFEYIDLMLKDTTEYANFREYLRNLVKPLYFTLGWTPSSNHSEILNDLLREIILRLSCANGDSNCTITAMSLFQEWKANSSNYNVIPPDAREAVYCTGIKSAVNEESWEFMFIEYQNVDQEAERYRYRAALACTQETWLLKRYFEMGAVGDSSLYYTDYTAVMQAVAGQYPLGHAVAYDYMDQHWADMFSDKLSVLSTVASHLSTELDLTRFRGFKERHPPETENQEESYKDMEYVIEANIRWRQTNQAQVLEWLEDALQKTTEIRLQAMKVSS